MQRTLWSALFLASTAATMHAQTPVAHPPFPTGTGTPLVHTVASVLADPEVARAHVGVAVVAVDGTPIYGLNEGQLFRPASNAKLFTTAAAMALLGPDTRLTAVISSDAAPDADGVIHGDITFHGVGDANLGWLRIPYESPEARKKRLAAEFNPSFPDPISDYSLGTMKIGDLASQVAQKGVTRVNGALRGDESLWHGAAYAPSWDEGDAIWGYGASVSALEYDDGEAILHVRPGNKAGDPASLSLIEGDSLAGKISNHATTVADSNHAEIDIEPSGDSLVVVGSIAIGHTDDEEIAVRDPALDATSKLAMELRQYGVKGLTGTEVQHAPGASSVPFNRQVKQPIPNLAPKPASLTSPICGRDFQCGFILAEHVSPTLAEDVTITLKVSQNLHAEMMLRRLGRAYGTEGSFAQGARVVRQWLLNAGIDGDDFVFYDGSGLSSHDLVTPRATTSLLTFAARQPWFAQWKAALPIGGVDGSLSSRFKDGPLKGHVFAKTGTLGESRALSGYVDCASGKTVAFAIFVDTHLPGHSEGDVIDKIVAAIATSN